MFSFSANCTEASQLIWQRYNDANIACSTFSLCYLFLFKTRVPHAACVYNKAIMIDLYSLWRDFSTCRGSAQHHWLSSGDTEVPDPIAMAHILLEQLAQSPGAGGGFETGHDLKRVWGREKYNGLTELS